MALESPVERVTNCPGATQRASWRNRWSVGLNLKGKALRAEQIDDQEERPEIPADEDLRRLPGSQILRK